MINAMKNLQQGKLEEIPSSMSYPILRWCSGNEKNLEVCNRLNKQFFFIPPEMIYSNLYFNMSKGFWKYPKSKKENWEKLEVVKKYLKIIYGWSSRDFEKHKRIVEGLVEDESFIKELHKKVAFDDKERKIFGIKTEAKKYKFQEIKKGLEGFW